MLRRSGAGPDCPATASAADRRSPRLHRDDVLNAIRADDGELAELEDAGLVIARTPGWYDADALIIATVAAHLAALGIGARHLRAYRAAADREVGLFAALVAPLAKSSSPAAHARGRGGGAGAGGAVATAARRAGAGRTARHARSVTAVADRAHAAASVAGPAVS